MMVLIEVVKRHEDTGFVNIVSNHLCLLFSGEKFKEKDHCTENLFP